MKRKIFSGLVVFMIAMFNISVLSFAKEENEKVSNDTLIVGEEYVDIYDEGCNSKEKDLETDNIQNDLEEEQVQNKNVFIEDENGIRYYGDDGSPVVGEFRIDNYLYIFDEDGYMKLGLQENSEGKSLYTSEKPYICVDEIKEMEDGTRYFDENGLMVTGDVEIASKHYYFDTTGVMYSQKWRNKGDKKCYYKIDGTMALGFEEIEGYTYYFDSMGYMVTGVKKINSNWYYFDETGVMQKGWRTVGNQKFYYHEDGKLALGVNKIDGYWYFFKNDGNMYKGWRTLGNQKFYYHADGKLAQGANKIGGYWYFFKNDGNMYKGWRTLGNQKFYYHADGKLAQGANKIDGYWYFFKNDGNMYKGWRTIGNEKYYYDGSGKLQIGKKVIAGKKYFFNRDGSLAEDYSMCVKAQQYSSKTNKMILVDTKKNRVGIFNGSKGKWSQTHYWKCTSGARSTPTVKGQFTVGIKGKVFGKGYSCWYYTQFYGDYLFHSILYNPGSMTSVQDGRLGINASHGCVRLSLTNAKWIYNNISKGTKVVIY